MAVVKARGYGHGLAESVAAAVAGGAACIGVASVPEGLAVRGGGYDGPVLVLGASLPDAAEAGVVAGLSLTVSSVPSVEAIRDASRKVGRTAAVHVKLETGMGRVGAYPDEAARILEAVGGAGLTLEGLSTHVGWDDTQSEAAAAQVAAFRDQLADLLPACPVPPRWTHAANSLMTVTRPDAHFNLVRVGLLTYGIPPCKHPAFSTPPLSGLSPALSVHARLTQVRQLRPGQPVSYGGTHTVDTLTAAAIVPVGYADGYPRAPGGGGHVIVDGHPCPILGTVCMDQMVVDVTGRTAAVGDPAVLVGSAGGFSVTVGDLAARTGRTTYEMVTGTATRLPVRYVNTP